MTRNKTDINAIRETVVTIANGSTDMSMVNALALIYLGDSIREAMSDIGPAINRVSGELRR